MVDKALDGPGRPLTRRELRELGSGGADPTTSDEAQPTDGVLDELPDDSTGTLPRATTPDEPVAAVPAAQDEDEEDPEGAGVDADSPAERDEATATDAAWEQVVDWSLHHELPKQLPPEPEVDDVRWDPVSSAMDDPQAAFTGPLVPVGPGRAGWTPARSPGPDPTAPVPRAPSEQDGADRPDEGLERPADASGAPTLAAPPSSGGQPPPAIEPPSASALGEPLPTLTDLLAARPTAPAGPAESGWQGTLRRLSGGLVSPAPGRAERHRRAAVATVQRSLDGPKTVVVINPKGGAHKTTATMMLASTFGMHRGGYTLAWDNNETRGTLGWRSHQSRHHNTAVNLLQDLDRFADPGSARVGDLDNYVRSQGSAQFDVLASDEDAASAASIDAFAFRSLHRTLSRFYRVMVVDTGNNMRASNWQAAIEAADQVVIVSTVREDTAQSAAWAVDALRATGHEDVVRRAVTVLSAPAAQVDDRLADRLHEHFGRLTRAVLDVPYDPSLVAGRPLEYDALSPSTRDAWLHVTAAVAEGL